MIPISFVHSCIAKLQCQALQLHHSGCVIFPAYGACVDRGTSRSYVKQGIESYAGLCWVMEWAVASMFDGEVKR